MTTRVENDKMALTPTRERTLLFGTVAMLALATAVSAREGTPLTEPTNRPVPPKLSTAGIYSFCWQDQSLAFVAGDNRTLVHQIFGVDQTSAQPLQFEGEISHLALSPDGRSLAAIVNRTIFLVADRMAADTTRVDLPEAFEVNKASTLRWSADSKTLFLVNRGSPASALRIATDRPNQPHSISFQDGRHFFTSPKGDLLVAFSSECAEIWRHGVDTNKLVGGEAGTVIGSRDGRFLAFMAGNTLHIWTLDPLGKGGSVAAYGAKFIQFSSDGNRLLVFGVDDKAKCYEVSEKGQLRLSQDYVATNGCGWLSDDGKVGAGFSYSRTSRLMRVFRCDRNADTEIPIVTTSYGLGGYDPDIFPEQFQLSQDARRGLVVWPAGRIEMFDIRIGLSNWGCRVPDLAEAWLIAKGDRLLTIDKSGNLQLHDTSIGRVHRKTVNVEEQSVDGKHVRDTQFRFQVLRDGKHCVVWCGPKLRQFKVVEMSTGKVVGGAKDSREDHKYTHGWHASDDGSVVCVVGERVRLLKTGFVAEDLKYSENRGRFHITVKATGVKGPVHGIYDTRVGQMRRTLRWEFVASSGFNLWGHVSRDGQLCALVGKRLDGKGKGVEVRSTTTGEQLFAVPLPESDFSWLDFTADKRGMWVVTRQALMRLDFENKTLMPVFTDSETQTDPVDSDPKKPTPLPDSEWQTTQFQCFSESDTGWIATGHRRGFVNIWSNKDNKRYAFLRCGTEEVEALAFSPDGRYLLSWFADRNQLQVTDVSSILPTSPPAPKADGQDDLDLDF